MKKEKLLTALLVLIVIAAIAIFIINILSSPSVDIITPPTVETRPPTVPNNPFDQDVGSNNGNTTPTDQSGNESTNPTDPSGDTSDTQPENSTKPTKPNEIGTPQYKFSGMMFKPNDKIFESHAVIDKYLPRSNTRADWWQNKYFSSPEEETMYEDLGWLFDLEDERVMKWDVFQNKKVKDLLIVNGYGAIFVVEGEITPYQQAVVVTEQDVEKTVGEALSDGEWMYSIRDIDKIDNVCQQLFGLYDVEYASQLISTWGIPTKTYYNKLDDWTYNYVFEYQMSDCSVLIYGNEIPHYMTVEEAYDVPRGELLNLTIYGVGNGAEAAKQYELRDYEEIN